MKLGELFGEDMEDIVLSEEDIKEYNDWLEKLQYTINDLDLSNILMRHKKSAKTNFKSVEIVLNALKEIVLK